MARRGMFWASCAVAGLNLGYALKAAWLHWPAALMFANLFTAVCLIFVASRFHE